MPHPEWLDSVGIDDVIGALLALLLIGGLVLVLVKMVHPLMVKLTRVLDLILGRPDQQGIPGKPSMMDRFDALDDRMRAQDVQIAEIKGQVTPNHGSSAHDKLTRRIGRVDFKVDALFRHLGVPIPPDDDPPA
jgi:hypothetical protein